MKSKFYNLLVFSILCLILNACSQSDTPYFPLEANQEWQYKVTITTMDGTRNEKYLQQNFPQIELEGKTLWPRQAGDGSRLFYTLTEEGIFHFSAITNAGQKMINDPLSPVLIYPLEVGTNWQKRSSTFLLEKSGPPQDTLFRITEPLNLQYEIVSMNETVVVPAGRFENCMKVEAKGLTNADVGNYIGKVNITIEHTFWYAKEKGLIKSTRVETTDNPSLNRGEYVMELER